MIPRADLQPNNPPDFVAGSSPATNALGQRPASQPFARATQPAAAQPSPHNALNSRVLPSLQLVYRASLTTSPSA
jgi:hypothetical protein